MGRLENRTGYGIANANPDEWSGRTRVPPPKRDSKIEKWRAWVGRIRDEMINEIFTNRAAFQAVNEVLDSNPSIPGSDVLEFWAGNYGRSQAVAVRRQTDAGGQVVTLGRLLGELESDSGRLTRRWWVGQYEWGHQGRADRDFDIWAYLDPDAPSPTETGNELSALKIRHDIERLADSAAAIRHHVDRVIAHADEKPPRLRPTFGDLDRAIDVLGEVFRSYYTLITCAAIIQLDAVPQYDRLAPFRQPWVVD